MAIQVMFLLLYILAIAVAHGGIRFKKPRWLWPFILLSVSSF
jgi:hypothetical protein